MARQDNRGGDRHAGRPKRVWWSDDELASFEAALEGTGFTVTAAMKAYGLWLGGLRDAPPPLPGRASEES